ncbi:ATP synthase subunit s, mitochondrial isoform X1 [Agrilus planipennis]|uniref:ATP synthase subunit s, mitochondrial isoform X1 n=1 Tax=Agrilus planipennis TaxID=224129 RepID=A0A7F5RC04_AGRPL|nr:ATP synthase subunit s, mitochondrial isoform X1 [Agrilus planipennis]XP_025833475.1 ATP synthase subunit s, mitochondrial isoform X1 [Agrilus planipennis]
MWARKLYPTLLKTVTTVHTTNQSFWAWLNIVFNRVDEDRVKRFGPDRACAEWLLRNGASVKFCKSSRYLSDYNSLPIEGSKFFLEEIDATDSSIMHHGFPHFVGCKFIRKIKFHKCIYLENEALGMLAPLRESLLYLQISECNNIDSEGLKKLDKLHKLKELILFNLPYVRDKDAIVNFLQNYLPLCNIDFKEETHKEVKTTMS